MSETPTQTVTRSPTSVELELAKYEPQIAAALPEHIDVGHFKRVVLTAINQNPELWDADRRSFFVSCVQAAHDGLFPDGREAAFVIFNTRNKKTNQWEAKVQYMPMYQGIIKRMRNTGEVASVDAQVVYDQDAFDYELGDEPFIKHKPSLAANRGNPIAAYAIIKLTNGEIIREVMSVGEIEKVRAVSKSGEKEGAPWKVWWDPMARKTVLRRASKRAPLSSTLRDLLDRDEQRAIAEEIETGKVVDIPARPTRAQFREPTPQIEKPLPPRVFSITNYDGEITDFEGAGSAAAALSALLTQAPGIKALDGIWETNGVVVGLIREVSTSAAENAHAAYAARQEALKPKGGKKTEKVLPEATKPAELGSPLQEMRPDLRQAAWPPFVLGLVAQIDAAADLNGAQAVLKSWSQEWGHICAERLDDMNAVMDALNRKTVTP